MYQTILNAPVTWSADIQYQAPVNIMPNGIGGLLFAVTTVVYNGITYFANGTKIPTKATTPNLDNGWSVLIDPSTSAEVLSTPLTDLTAAAGIIKSTDTILQGFNKLSYNTYAYIKGFNASGISNGYATLNNGVDPLLSDNLALNATNVTISNDTTGKMLLIQANLHITSDSGADAIFGINGTNLTLLGHQDRSIGANFDGYIALSAIAKVGTSSTVGINISSVTNGVNILNDSYLTISPIIS